MKENLQAVVLCTLSSHTSATEKGDMEETMRTNFKMIGSEGAELLHTSQLYKYSRTPKPLMHTDSYGKLKTHGITVRGSITRFCHHIIWLKVDNTNIDPKAIVDFFVILRLQ